MRRSLNQPKVAQHKLFHPCHQSPAWQGLPSEFRLRTVGLLAPLLANTPEESGAGAAGRWRAMSDKIKSQHLQRKAILYVRQSPA